MPLYEYECTKCGHRFEALQKAKDRPLEKCPKCGGPLRKLISSPAIQFKGSGWYITDYAKKSSAAAGEAKPSSAPEAKSAPAAEKKDEKKTPPKTGD
jgi:putative FmdB family regulatory protein